MPKRIQKVAVAEATFQRLQDWINHGAHGADHVRHPLGTDKHELGRAFRQMTSEFDVKPVRQWSAMDKFRFSMFIFGKYLAFLVARPRASFRRAPGIRLNAFAEFVYSKKTYERIFRPTIADLQAEYLEALEQGRPGKARWAWVRGHFSFWAAVAAQFPVSILRLVVKIWTTASS